MNPRPRKPHPRKPRFRNHGWIEAEITTILAVLGILTAILAPTIGRYVHNAKIVRAREDTQMLGCSIWMYIEDTANSHFMIDGSCNPCLGASRCWEDVCKGICVEGSAPDQMLCNRVEMLVGNGDIPQVGADGCSAWALSVNYREVDFMEYHLITNKPGNDESRSYRTPKDLVKGPYHMPQDPMFARDESGGFNSEFAWRGPYVNRSIDADPWGNRYMANVGFLDPRAGTTNDGHLWYQGDGDGCFRCYPIAIIDPFDEQFPHNGHTEDVMVLTAGPDEEIDTCYALDGNTPGDDDIAYTVSANSRP